MKVAITTVHGLQRKRLLIEGDTIGVKVPKEERDLLIEAQLDEGSPIQIVVANGAAPIPVRQLRLVHSKTYYVQAFKRRTKAGVVTVEGHTRRRGIRRTGKTV
jgi:hypothetical protein